MKSQRKYRAETDCSSSLSWSCKL